MDIETIKKITRITKSTFVKGVFKIYEFLPVFLLTDRFYTNIFGEYSVNFNAEYVANFFLTPKPYYCILMFSALIVPIYLLEEFIIPLLILSLYKNKISKQDFKLSKIKTNIFLKKMVGMNPLTYMKKEYLFAKCELYKPFIIMALATILWLIFINNIWSYMLIVVVILLSMIVFKILNSIYEYH